MLSEDEKKAIKYFYNLRSTIDESYMLFDEEINVKCGKETIKQITLVLNLITNYKKEIEDKDKKIKTLNHTNKSYKGIINKQNKQINLMAEYMEENMDEYQLDEIYSKQYSCNGMERNWTRGKEKEVKDIKLYFEKLAKEKE